MTTARVKLLKFTTLFAIGGTERHVMNFVANLDTSRFDLQLACLRKMGEFLDEIEARRIPLAEYRTDRLYGRRALRQQLRFARDLRASRTQIVHTYGFYPNVFAIAAARMASTPVVIASIRDTGVYLSPWQKRVQKLACRLADVVLVNADAIRRTLVDEGYPPQRIHVIRNGVSPSAFVRRSSGHRIREELGVAPETPIVAMLSRLNGLKGVDDFLHAAGRVVARVPDARFLIIGDSVAVKNDPANNGSYRDSLRESAARLGLADRIVFTGFRMDVPELLSECAVSVLPSLSEGLSNTLLESMAAGVPVVATNVGGNPEVVQEGTTGFLVPPQNPEVLAERICRVLEDRALAARFGEAGRRRVAEHFSVERMLRETERLYLTLLQRPQAVGAITASAATPSCP
jgi:glycosyltransferase involved in cell wall biosynthesis